MKSLNQIRNDLEKKNQQWYPNLTKVPQPVILQYITLLDKDTDKLQTLLELACICGIDIKEPVRRKELHGTESELHWVIDELQRPTPCITRLATYINQAIGEFV